MTIEIDQLIDELKIHAPIGVEVPRDPNTNLVSESTIERWAADAAQAINERRGKTTTKETTVTLVADTVDYALPADCRDVIEIQRRHATVQSTSVLGIPVSGYNGPTFSPFGNLPTGQEVSPALDAINRSRLAITEREDDFELIGGQLRLLFPIDAGEVIVVRYRAIDRSYAEVGDDRFTAILTYLLYQNLEWWLGKHGASIAQDHDALVPGELGTLYRRKAELESKWYLALNSIGPEA